MELGIPLEYILSDYLDQLNWKGGYFPEIYHLCYGPDDYI